MRRVRRQARRRLDPFRVTFTITNGTKKPYDMDSFGYNAQGATTGGEAESLYVKVDSKQMAGRLAPGRSATFTSEYSIAKSDGKEVLFTMSRSDEAWLESGSFLGDDPQLDRHRQVAAQRRPYTRSKARHVRLRRTRLRSLGPAAFTVVPRPIWCACGAVLRIDLVQRGA